MQTLPSIICPSCGQTINSRPFEAQPGKSGPPAATSFADCLRQCEPCGIGFSNARAEVSQLTQIHRSPLAQWPAEIRDGCDETLALALNEQNRTSKQNKFAFSSSEDHLTWAVFKFLQISGGLGELFRQLELCEGTVEQTLLLWGVPVPLRGARAEEIRARLIQISEALGERSLGRSEPDVIVEFDAKRLLFVEVKYGSGNEVKPPDYPTWDRYLAGSDCFANGQGIRESGLYELARNWRIGWELSGGDNFTLINLGPASLFSAPNETRLQLFKSSLAEGNGTRFVTLDWTDFIKALPSTPEWLDRYLRARGLSS